MAMSELHQQIHAALITIQANGPKDELIGICGNVVQILGEDAEMDDDVDDALLGLFEDWPEKSHSTVYPVGNWSMVPSKLFWHCHDSNKSMWDRKTKYGAARWALLKHAINKMNQGEN